MANISEAQWQRQVVDLARLLGWRHHHCADSRRSTPGLPDLLLIRDRVVWAELKTDTGRVRPAQQETLRALQAAGAEAYIWRPGDLAHVQAVLTRRGRLEEAA